MKTVNPYFLVKIVSITILITCFNFNLYAQHKRVNKKSLLKEWNKIDKFQQLVKDRQPDFPFYLALVVNGKIISEKKNGYANIGERLKLDKTTIHSWGSVSKLFITISILQLVEKGQIKLEDPIVKWLPELGTGVDSLGGMQAVKLYHLLNHTSGIEFKNAISKASKKAQKIQKEKGLDFRFPTTKEFLSYLKYANQVKKPGTKYKYSNMGYSVVGLILEKATNLDFRTYIRQNILEKLHMNNTFYGALPEAKFKRYETGYSYIINKKGEKKLLDSKFNLSQGAYGPNGGLKSTSEDMVKFMNFFRFRNYKSRKYQYEKVLKKETLDRYIFKVNTNVEDKSKFAKEYQSKKYQLLMYKILGISKSINTTSNNVFYGHTGRIALSTSYFYFNESQPFGVMMISNMSSSRKLYPRKLIGKLYFLLLNFAANGNFGNDIQKLSIKAEK